MTTNTKTKQNFEILPPFLAINSMRSSGYRDTAHAVAELIDNSIQAGKGVNECTKVELLCLDTVHEVRKRKRQNIHKIAVYDNASGMDSETLRIALQFGNGTNLIPAKQKGIGKFGMGLPNASISQCKRVDVWSWQNGNCLYTYLDVNDIVSGDLREVPEPVEKEIPKEWSSIIADKIGSHGTLVVWSNLDRVRWKTSDTFLNKAEFLVGRMYRYFLVDKSASIRLASFSDFMGKLTPSIDRFLKPNDPLYVMEGTCAPEPYDENPAFDLYTERTITVKTNGEEHDVVLRFSITKTKAREDGGGSAIGKHTAKNQGVSIVRANRELEMNHTFDISYDPRERWWGVEVRFESELDDIFGVTNNKQSATAFKALDREEDANIEGLTWELFRKELEETNDPRQVIYTVSHEIKNTLGTLREQIKRMREGTREPGDNVPQPGSAEDIATQATKKRREKIGKSGRSDEDEKKPVTERTKELSEELIEHGVEEEEAKEIAIEVINKGIKYLFQEGSLPGAVIFDVRAKAGTIIIEINTRHPASKYLFELLKEEDGENDSPALKALKLLLTAWARLEDEAEGQRRMDLENMRTSWGMIAQEFLQTVDD